MAILSGKWSLKAIENEAGSPQRITITGSNKDGKYPMVIGTRVDDLSGERIEITAQALDPRFGQRWVGSAMKEVMRWSADQGITVTLFCDDDPLSPDGDFNDLVVECTSNDPILMPPDPSRTRLNLAIPEHYIVDPPERPDDSGVYSSV
jgi:hypothetical protein